MRWIMFAALLLGVFGAQAQRPVSVDNRRPNACETIVSGQELNPYAYVFRDHCRQIDAQSKQQIAKIYGRPQPSRRVLSVPAHGSPESKRLRISCIDGLVMLRIRGGWEQAVDEDRRYYRCRDAPESKGR